VDSSVAEDGGIVDVNGTVDALNNPDVTADTSLYPAVVDGDIVDTGVVVDLTDGHAAGLDGDLVDAGDLLDVASDSSGAIDS
jgi:hypothetical protein